MTQMPTQSKSNTADPSTAYKRGSGYQVQNSLVGHVSVSDELHSRYEKPIHPRLHLASTRMMSNLIYSVMCCYQHTQLYSSTTGLPSCIGSMCTRCQCLPQCEPGSPRVTDQGKEELTGGCLCWSVEHCIKSAGLCNIRPKAGVIYSR